LLRGRRSRSSYGRIGRLFVLKQFSSAGAGLSSSLNVSDPSGAPPVSGVT
jgi:hypothetical protein